LPGVSGERDGRLKSGAQRAVQLRAGDHQFLQFVCLAERRSAPREERFQ
jgi:hypothetical protein